MLMSMNRCPPPAPIGEYTGKLCYGTIPGGVPGNSFALPDVDVVCSKETATGLPRKRTRSSVLQAMGKEAFNKQKVNCQKVVCLQLRKALRLPRMQMQRLLMVQQQ